MRILTIVTGTHGQRYTDNIRERCGSDWTVNSHALPPILPQVIDYPEEYLPDTLPAADLLLSLGEHPGVAELLPDIAQMCGASAVIVAIDNVAWLPPGLMNQLAKWLADVDVQVVFPKPFCSLTENTYNAYRRQVSYDIPLVAEFARRFGRPVFDISFDDSNTTIVDVQVLRDTPCGCAQHVANGLVGVSADDAEHEAGMLHHHFPCLASMAIDPDYSDTLMHVSGHLLRDEVARTVKPHKSPTVYLRPSGGSQ